MKQTLKAGSFKPIIVAALLFMAGPTWAVFERYQPEVMVADPYIEMHTAPGRGFPIFYVAGHGEQVTVLKRHTDWFKVRTERGKEGWVQMAQMKKTLDLDGEAIDWREVDFEDFSNRRWQVGMSGGDFDGARTLTAYAGYAMTPNITLQLEGGEILGDFSDGETASVSVLMFPFPDWRISPYFTIGTGIVRTKPHTTIVQTEDREDEIAHAGLGADVYLSDRFVLRMEYKRHTVLTSRDDNEEVNQWKAGFSVFF